MTIKLFGDVTSDEWVWLYDFFNLPCFSPKVVRDAIAELPDGEDLIIEVNSPGGDAWAGFEIFGLLQALGERTEAHIIAMAASAATTITSACARVLASPVAQIMIHQPSVSPGNVDNTGAQQLLNFLDSVKASIINGYLVKCGGKTTRRTLEKLVDKSTWMPAQDAIALGLVDGLLDTTEETAAAITAGGGIGVTNSAAGNSVTSLLERYEAAVRADPLQEVPGHPVQRESAQAAGTEATEAADLITPEDLAANTLFFKPGLNDLESDARGTVPGEDPVITENREVVENLISDWRLQAAIDLEREKVQL